MYTTMPVLSILGAVWMLEASALQLEDLEFEVLSTMLTFKEESSSIGWIPYSTCIEGNNPSVYNSKYTLDELVEMAQYAVTVRILPSTDTPAQIDTADYTVTADLCSNPIYALNNGYSLGYTVNETSSPPVITGTAGTDNWIGNDAAIALLVNSCDDDIGAEPGKLEDHNVYFACGNDAGLHFRNSSNGNDLCWFDWYTYTGHDVSMWLGFDGSKKQYCMMSDDGTYQMDSDATTADPSTMPTTEPTKNCDLLQIDEYLLDCSAEWDNAENTISTMEASVETNAADILTATTSIAANTADIATNAADTATNAADIVTNAADIASCTSSASTNAADISSNAADIGTATTSIAANTEDIGTNTADIASYTSSVTTNMTSAQASITSLETRVAELEDILDQLAGNSAAEDAAADRLINYPLQGDNVGMMDGMWNGVTLTGKDLGIVVLAAFNVIMIMCMVIACKRSGGRTKYQAVAVGSDIEPMNA